MTRKSSWLIAGFLGMLGVIDVILRCHYSIDCEVGFISALHDPGKSFFHIFLLPTAVFFILRKFPRILKKVSSPSNFFAIALPLLAFLVATIFTLKNAETNFFENLSTPEDVWEKELRVDFFKKRQSLSRKVYEENYNPEQAVRDFKNYAREKLENNGRSFGQYLKISSPRRHVATLLSLCGALGAVAIFGLICTIPFSAKYQFNDQDKQVILGVSAIFALWFPLKVYSNWYRGFKHFTFDDVALLIGFILVFAIVFLAYSIEAKTLFFKISGFAASGLSLIFTLIMSKWPEWLEPLLIFISNMKLFELLTIYTIVIIVGLAYLRILIKLLDEKSPTKEGQKKKNCNDE